MQILLNGRAEDLPGGMTLEQLLITKNIASAAVVVAVNSEVVKREAWCNFVIKENDEVEVIRIVGGG
ncbi:sulfur carrier protein ThiS [Moorella naiadis]|uniref:sulfur carrier protein ThiS n=1 Tax=Moorella naiadis (nom. illeg.) TaxID=3093670 RepID=UPI003D9CA80B